MMADADFTFLRLQRAHESALAVKDSKIQFMDAKLKAMNHKYQGMLEAKDDSFKEEIGEMSVTMEVKKQVVGSVDRGRIKRILEQDLEIQVNLSAQFIQEIPGTWLSSTSK